MSRRKFLGSNGGSQLKKFNIGRKCQACVSMLSIIKKNSVK
jgi:hypothetical protein